jgi:hypothetical protein
VTAIELDRRVDHGPGLVTNDEKGMEHRSAATPEPVGLELVEGAEAGPYLRRSATAPDEVDVAVPLPSRVLEVVGASNGAVYLEAVRDAVRARKQSVVDVLRELVTDGRVVKSGDDWRLPEP